jgi:hypothetical protein
MSIISTKQTIALSMTPSENHLKIEALAAMDIAVKKIITLPIF